jgi:hypothetical protein
MMSQKMIELACRCGHMCAIDSVVGVCNPNMSIISIVVSDEHGIPRVFFVALISNESKEQWVWALRSFVEMSKVRFQTILIDEGVAVVAAVKEVFPTSKVRHCLFHVESNFKQHLKVSSSPEEPSTHSMKTESPAYHTFKTVWHSVIFANTKKAISARWESLMLWLQEDGLFDLAAYFNRCMRDKLDHICNIYFEDVVTHLSTSIVEGNHSAFKSLLKKQSGASTYNARLIHVFRAIQAAVKDQPSSQHRSSVRSNVQWGRRVATALALESPFGRIKRVIDSCFGTTVQEQVSEHNMLPLVSQYGMKHLSPEALQIVIELLERSYDDSKSLGMLPTLGWHVKKNHVLTVRNSMYTALKEATKKSNLVFFIYKFTDTPLTELHHHSDYFGNNWDDDASQPDGIDGENSIYFSLIRAHGYMNVLVRTSTQV